MVGPWRKRVCPGVDPPTHPPHHHHQEREGLTYNALRLESEVLGKIQGRFAPRLLHYSAGGEQLPSTLALSGGGSKGDADEGSGASSGGGGKKRSGSPFRRKAPPVRVCTQRLANPRHARLAHLTQPHNHAHTHTQSIVMELLKGEDMSEMRHRQPSAPRVHPRVAVHLGKEIFRLLRRLHALGFVHRDIKPK